MTTYKLTTGQSVMRTDDRGVWGIPFDPTNTDYQEYQRWLAEGNTPEPADQLTT